MKLWLLASLLMVMGCDAGAGDVATPDGQIAANSADLAGTPPADLTGVPPADLTGVPPADLTGAPPADLANAPDGTVAPSPYLFPAVWVILMENHDRPTLLSTASAPKLQALASTFAQAGKYSTPLSPSLPNYIEMTCGCNSKHAAFDATDATAQSLLTAGKPLFAETSLGAQLETAAVPWRAYAQDSATNSKLTPCYAGNVGEYVSRHVPFVYFTDLFGATSPSATCTQRVRVFGDPNAKTGDFYTDLAANTYAYQWITPDLLHDMHDGTIKQGDVFVDTVVTDIQKTPQYQAGGVIFILWDEGSATSNQILFIAVSKRAKMGFQSMTAFTHDNFLATVQDIFKLPRTGAAVGVANMMELFQ